ncbi:MAG TPA: Ig-like domain-containing protein, partial [Roseimicrobium sp.]|nr:Ig-like domain-containing protein [Roseimicrobium sp.]
MAFQHGRVFGAVTNTVTIDNLKFNLNSITIGVGDTVVWRNNSEVSHTVTGNSGSDPLCGSRILYEGDICRRTFTAIGTNYYHCTIHTYMTGRVIVIPVPSVTITNPATNAVFAAPATFSVRANATVAVGTIKNVVLKSGTNTLITLTNT